MAAGAGCDAVLQIELRRYQDRDGGDYSVKSPASVAFDLRLVHAASGKVLWFVAVDETQESLLDNVFSLNKAVRRGFQWLTVDELADQAMTDALARCSYLQPGGTAVP